MSGLDKVLLRAHRQAIIWSNGDLLMTETLGAMSVFVQQTELENVDC